MTTRKIIQLDETKTKAHWKFEYNPDVQQPLKELYTPDFVARMIDVTDMDPEPQEGWAWDGQKFIAPEVKPQEVVEAVVNIDKIMKDLPEVTARAILSKDSTELKKLIDQLDAEKAKLEASHG